MKLIGVLMVCLTLVYGTAVGFEWQTYTSVAHVTGLAGSDGLFMASTTGGALLYDYSANLMQKFTNTDGLGGIEINACAYGDSYFWLGSSTGELSCYNTDLNGFTQFLLVDRDGSRLRINNLYYDDGLLWISTNIGVSLFDIERHGGEIRETYRRFGDIPGGTEVEGVTLLNDTVWIATQRGIAYAAANDPNLLDYTHWKSFNADSLPELPSDDFIEICSQDGKMWALAENYAIQFEMDAGEIGITETVVSSADIKCCLFSGDSLYLGCTGGLFQVWADGTLSEIETFDYDITDIAINPGTGLILGSNGLWLYIEFSPGGYIAMGLAGPANNQITALAESGPGSMWFAHNNGHASQFALDEWHSMQYTQQSFISAEPDNDGSVWMGTFGGGVVDISGNSSADFYDTTGTTLIGNSDNNGENYIVVFDIHLDTNDVVWFACYRGLNRQPIAFLDKNSGEWGAISYAGFKPEAKIFAVHSEGDRVWAGFEDDGIYLIEYGEDPFDNTDYQFTHFTRSESLLPSDQVNCINVDHNGVVWAGTDMGLAYFDPGVNLFIRTILPEGIGPQITAIEFDVRNNMWIGTQSGLAFRASGSTDFSYFTTENSDIIDDNINSLHFAGDLKLWVATDVGISSLAYNIGNVTDIISEVYAYPNPFILSTAEDRVYINYINEVEVQIYSLDGSKVKTILSNAGWDGTNENGDKVSSGMYLFYIRDNQGNDYTGKIAVIRK